MAQPANDEKGGVIQFSKVVTSYDDEMEMYRHIFTFDCPCGRQSDFVAYGSSVQDAYKVVIPHVQAHLDEEAAA